MALIDKSKTVESIATYLFINDAIRGPEPRKISDYLVFGESMLKDIPELDLVMCKDCYWSRPRTLPGETGYRCVFYRVWKGENGYCDNGERGEL